MDARACKSADRAPVGFALDGRSYRVKLTCQKSDGEIGMELAQAVLLLWQRKTWVAVGVVVALGAGILSVQVLKKEVYATAATQMMVDSSRSPLANAGASLDPFTARANVFANLMTSWPALTAIGRAAGIPANQISATGPTTSGQAVVAAPVSAPTSRQAPARFKLFVDQDPTLPTIDIYAQAPTTRQATALADGAVTGFASYLSALENQGSISADQRVQIRQLGAAVGGIVDPGANKKIAAVIVLMVLLVWCAAILLIERRRGLRPESTRREPARAKTVRGSVADAVVPFLGGEALYALRIRDRPTQEQEPQEKSERRPRRRRTRATSNGSRNRNNNAVRNTNGTGNGNGNGNRNGATGGPAPRAEPAEPVATVAEPSRSPDED
jgi:hypothetical protein